MTHQPNHHMPPCGCPPMQPVAVGEINYSAEQINQLLALIPLKMDRKELHGLISYTSDNYIGHVPDTTSLKPQKAFAWAFVGELSGASPYFYYTPDFIPEGLEEGWNDMSSFFGKYNMTPSKKEDTISAEELFAGYFRLPTLTADKAIADEQGNRIIDTYVKREAVANHIKETYNKQFTENPPLITKGYITPEMLSEETRQMLEATGQDITNLPDGEDLQAVHGVLKFANKEYNPNSYDGLGRQYIRRNIVNGVNTLVQSMVQWSNTLYIIRYDHDLQGRTITIPEGCTLMFESGKLYNGKVVLNDTQVRPYGCLLKDYIDCQIEGTFRKGQVLYSEQYKQTEVWTGKKWKCSYSVLFRVYGNKLQQSLDDGDTWEDVSDYIASYFRFVASDELNSVGKIQISQDNKTWTDLSPEITNYMRIADYVATTAELPKNAPQGLIYGVGPVDGSTYTLYVNTSKGWINNGSFTSFTAGVVQETGDNENAVMSQKAVTEKFNEQEEKLAELGSKLGGKIIKTFSVSIPGHSSKNDQVYINIKEGEVYSVLYEAESAVVGSYIALYERYEDGTEKEYAATLGVTKEIVAGGNVVSIGGYLTVTTPGIVRVTVTGGFMNSTTEKLDEIESNLSVIVPKNKYQNTLQLYTESTVYPYIETTSTSQGSIYIKSTNTYWYLRMDKLNTVYTNDELAVALGVSVVTSPMGIPSCLELENAKAIVYDSLTKKLVLKERDSISDNDILIISCMNGIIDRINTNVLGSYFGSMEDKTKGEFYNFIHFSGSLTPTFNISGVLDNSKLECKMPVASMNIYSNVFQTIQMQCNGESYTISSYEKLVYHIKNKSIKKVSGNTINSNYITLLTLSGHAVGGLLSTFFGETKATVEDVGKVYINEEFTGNGSTWVQKNITNIKKGVKLSLNGNATSHAVDPQETWIQIFYSKDGATKILLSKPIGEPMSFPWSIVLDEDVELLQCMFRFGSDEYIQINARSCVTMEDIQQNNGVVGEMLKNATDIMTFNPYPNVVEKFLQAKRKKPNGNTTSLVNTEDVLTLLHFSDIHGSVNNLERIIQFKDNYSEFIDDIIHTGDTVVTYLEDGNIFNEVKGAESILNVIGNHDAWNSGDAWYNATSIETYNLVMRGNDENNPLINNWGVIQPANAGIDGYCYYYKDYQKANIRLIVLDCMHYNETQKSWLSEVLTDSVSKGLSVVVAQHYPAQNGIVKVNTAFNDYDTELQGYDYSEGVERMDDSAYIAVDDYISSGGEFICWLEGHTHKNFIGQTPSHENQLQIIIENGGAFDYYNNSSRVEGTKTQDAFNLVAIDRESKLIKIVRIGSEYDRFMRHYSTLCYNYITKELISSN